MVRSCALTLVLSAAFVGGCGGSPDDEQIRAALRSYVEALDRDDAGAQCRLLSEHAKREFTLSSRLLQVDPAYADFARPAEPPVRSCPSAVRFRSNAAATRREPRMTEQHGAFDNLGDVDVKVESERATASDLKLPYLNGSQVVPFVRVRGAWLLDERVS